MEPNNLIKPGWKDCVLVQDSKVEDLVLVYTNDGELITSMECSNELKALFASNSMVQYKCYIDAEACVHLIKQL